MQKFDERMSLLLDEAIHNIERGRWWWVPVKRAVERWIFSE